MSMLDFSHPLIMGILNLTPDSFSDGGSYDPESAVRRAAEMVEEGADIIDIGGESTRPEAMRVSAAEQKSRVLNTLQLLRDCLPDGFPVSIDTTSSDVARHALDSGANMINDISAGREDPEILALAASAGVPLVLMHMQGTPETMQHAPAYRDVVAEVKSFLHSRVEAALTAGVEPEALLLDPGIGFGKLKRHNLQLLAGLQTIGKLGYPLLLGASRKRFMGSICNQAQPKALMPATCATTALGVMAGVKVFRVHDVWQNRQAADVAWAIRNEKKCL
ncbi:MAG: dihydropteroate synthase [Candidatus Thiodiazotropha sp.]